MSNLLQRDREPNSAYSISSPFPGPVHLRHSSRPHWRLCTSREKSDTATRWEQRPTICRTALSSRHASSSLLSKRSAGSSQRMNDVPKHEESPCHVSKRSVEPS